jgi:hypothetical protein
VGETIYPTSEVFREWDKFAKAMLLGPDRLDRKDVMALSEEIGVGGQLNPLRQAHRAIVDEWIDQLFRCTPERISDSFQRADPTLLALVADRMRCTTQVLMESRIRERFVPIPISLPEYFRMLMKQDFG